MLFPSLFYFAFCFVFGFSLLTSILSCLSCSSYNCLSPFLTFFSCFLAYFLIPVLFVSYKFLTILLSLLPLSSFLYSSLVLFTPLFILCSLFCVRSSFSSLVDTSSSSFLSPLFHIFLLSCIFSFILF